MTGQEIYGSLVTNTFVDVRLAARAFPELATGFQGRESIGAAVLQVQVAQVPVLCCLAGGKVDERLILRMGPGDAEGLDEVVEGANLVLTLMGRFTVAIATRFLADRKRVLFCPVRCWGSAAELKYQVLDALLSAEAGDLVIFVGDIAGACDGKILPLLNVEAVVELPIYREL